MRGEMYIVLRRVCRSRILRAWGVRRVVLVLLLIELNWYIISIGND